MARSTQKKVLAALEAAATSYGLDIVVDERYANTGTVRIEPTNGFEPVVTIDYEFHDEYAAFTVMPPQTIESSDGKLRAVKHDEMETRLLRPVRNALARYHQAQLEKEFAELKP